MKNWHYYDLTTGLFSGRTSGGNSDEYQPDSLEGFGAIEGTYDYLSQCVDLETGEVMDYQPPQSGDDYEWNAKLKRWVLTADAQAIIDADAQARDEIARLEAQQMRTLRETVLNEAGAKERLQAIDDQISALRPNLKR